MASKTKILVLTIIWTNLFFGGVAGYGIQTPEIHSDFHGHAIEGGTFNLTCSVKLPKKSHVHGIYWETPLGENNSRLKEEKYTVLDGSHHVSMNILTVLNAQRNDSGYYKCTAEESETDWLFAFYSMTILKNSENYINISKPINHTKIEKDKITLEANYRGFPIPELKWYNPRNELIQSKIKYEIQKKTNKLINLFIYDPVLEDTGIYILNANNSFIEKNLTFDVYVKDKPRVKITSIHVNSSFDYANVICKTDAYPSPTIIWNFTPCSIYPKWPTCTDENISFNSNRTSYNVSNIGTIHELIFKPVQPGKVECIANNEIGTNKDLGYVFMDDLNENMIVFGIDANHQIAKGDEVILTCATLANYYSADLDWFKNDMVVKNSTGIEVETNSSLYSYRKTIKFKNIEDYHAGEYECRARRANSNSELDIKSLKVEIYEPKFPSLINGKWQQQIELDRGEKFELACESDGLPKASITWFKDGKNIQSTDIISIVKDLRKNRQVLKILSIQPEDAGLYKCVASNRLGFDEASSKVNVKEMSEGLSLEWIIGIVFVISILVIVIIYLSFRIAEEREIWRKSGLANFEDGSPDQINPDLSLNEQADLLPYDRCFEFRWEKLNLGIMIGSGSFGKVHKAVAEGIIPGEKTTEVAVKMVKIRHDNDLMRALVSELKIMVHLGKHLNIVNLLGAVTQHIARRELMVIVEYCRFGNVQNILMNNRTRFINQIDFMTDKIDRIARQTFLAGEPKFNRHSENGPRSETQAQQRNQNTYSANSERTINSCATEQTVMRTIPDDDEDSCSINSEQPAWRSNYETDSTEEMAISTLDLICWAFQVARGMDYLASRKILHGDLAARNILLCDGNVVKICDFGLARSMYSTENYKKQPNSPVPVKWLALESLSDMVFNTYTDVWSFGIVLWEFFSLAKVPYPEIIEYEVLYTKLTNGYRLEKPPYANEKLYNIMLECWRADQKSRPLFNVLENKFGKLLGDENVSHFVKLNEPFQKYNNEHKAQRNKDYLALVGSLKPKEPQFSKTHNGYTQISTWQPIPESSTISNNPDTAEVIPEEIPLLHMNSNGNNSDGSQSAFETVEIGQNADETEITPTDINTNANGDHVNVNVNATDAYSNSSSSKFNTIDEIRKY